MIGLEKSASVDKAKRNIKLSSQESTDFFSSSSISDSGVQVNPESGLKTSAVWACVRLLSESVASLPLHTYRKGKNSRERAEDYPLYDLLKDRPNKEMDGFHFWEMAMVCLLLRGNFYAEKDYGNYGIRPLALYPILPDFVQVLRNKVTGELQYDVTDINGHVHTLGRDKIFHISGMGFNGLTGISVISYFKQSIGLTLAAEKFGSSFFGNGARPGGVLEHPGKLGDKAFDRLEKAFNDRHKGLNNAQRLGILEEGMKYHALQVSPDDAQFLQTREFQAIDIARIFNVPPQMIGVLTKGTTKQEELALRFVVHTLRGWLVRIESAIKSQLFGSKERKIYYPEFNVNSLLRGDFKSRMEGFAIARQNGWLNSDEIRAMDNLNPMPKKQGKIYLAPMNYVPLSKVEELADSQIKNQKNGTQDNPGSPKKTIADKVPGSPEPKRSLEPLKKDIAQRLQKRYNIDVAKNNFKLNRFRKFIDDCTKAYCEFNSMDYLKVGDALETLFNTGNPKEEDICLILEEKQ